MGRRVRPFHFEGAATAVLSELWSRRGFTETDVNADLEIIMLEALTIKEIENIISAAEELNAKHPSSELGISPATYNSSSYMTDKKMLVQKISALSPDARMELMALMWIGRDFEGNYNDALEYARQESGEGDVRYIAAKSPALPTYLKNGMKKVGLASTGNQGTLGH
jgi:Protein of unknown function (DUF3775)